MGNYRFKIFDMIPIVWFYKARNKTKKKQPITSSSSSSSPPHPTKPHPERKSYYFTRDLTLPDPNTQNHSPSPSPSPTPSPLPDPPRKSSKNRRPPTYKTPIHRKPAITAGRAPVEPFSTRPEPYPESTSSDNEFLLPDLPGSGHESFNSSIASCPCKRNSTPDDIFQKVDLPPIITKPDKTGSGKWAVENKEDNMGISRKEGNTTVRSRVSGGKFKANGYSPRVGSRVRVQAVHGGRRSMGKRRSLSESFAVVKTSVDPQRDFKESMVEMIMENNIKSSKDLEELLACYLSLNSKEYHDLIIKVFKQIWAESSDVRL